MGLASNSTWLREKKENLFVCMSVVAPMADGGLNFTNTFLRWDGWAGFPSRGGLGTPRT